MKKILNIAICLFAISCFMVPSVFGAEFANTVESDGGVRITITVAGVPTTTTNFTFDASPNVSMSVWTEPMSYSIMTTNILTNTTLGYEYGTLSSASGYAQVTKSVEPGAKVTACTSGTALPISDMTWVGGEGGS